MFLTFNKWARLTLVNLLVVALCGFVLRCKMLFPLPFISQKHLLHGHSHFAFSGWVSQLLMVFLVYYLNKQKSDIKLRRYQWLLMANFVLSYGMLIAFIIQGYAFYSILFSTLNILVAVLFAIFYWRDSPKKEISFLCFKGALLFNVLSSFGTISLGVLMGGKVVNQDLYLAAIYFFLHFQYNGWFFFGCMGILFMLLPAKSYLPNQALKAFWTLAIACVPAYFLSIIMFRIPPVVYSLAAIAGLVQLAGLILLFRAIYPALKNTNTSAKAIAVIIGMAVAIKFCLQGMSAIPALGALAFGFRPIIVAYLHLVLLAIVSLFLVVSLNTVFSPGRRFNAGLIFFIVAIAFNEILLFSQGLCAYGGVVVPFVHELLLGASVLLVISILILNVGFRKVGELNSF